jgi:hypothetical protein
MALGSEVLRQCFNVEICAFLLIEVEIFIKKFQWF